jgi:hypothetical protein
MGVFQENVFSCDFSPQMRITQSDRISILHFKRETYLNRTVPKA